jgi:hypothetical protein
MYRAVPCPCGDDDCKMWHVQPVAATQGVRFTRKQAHLVAAFLNKLPTDITADDDAGASA